MPWTRHVMQSVEIPVVTQTRVSGDYAPSNGQWMIGDSTIMAHAVGLAAFKDVNDYVYATMYYFTVVNSAHINQFFSI